MDQEKVCARKLEGKSAIVTGAAMGLGEGIATVYAKYGAELLLIDMSEKVEERKMRICRFSMAFWLLNRACCSFGILNSVFMFSKCWNHGLSPISRISYLVSRSPAVSRLYQTCSSSIGLVKSCSRVHRLR